MSNLLYNGVSLPAKPPAAAGYGVEVIVNVLPAGQSIYGGSAYLFVQGSRLLWQNGKCYVGGIYAVYRLSGDKWVWHYGSGTVSTQDIVAANYFNAIWTNTDIPNANGSGVYLAASEPVDPNAPEEPDEPEEPPVEPEEPTVTTTELRRSFGNGFILGMQVRGMLKKRVVEETAEADYYLYGTPSESGNIAVADGDGYVLYSGEVLPKIPAWDESAYPIATMTWNPSGGVGSISLTCTAERYWGKQGIVNTLCAKAPCLFARLTYSADSELNEWMEYTLRTSDVVTPNPVVMWTNTDLYRDEKLSTEATAPIPLISSMPVETIANGIKIPPLPEWDEEAYPYAVLSVNLAATSRYFGTLYILPALEYGVAASGKRSVKLDGGMSAFFSKDAENWQFAEFKAVDTGLVALSNIKWTNTDLTNEDGSVYLEASKPISVYEKWIEENNGSGGTGGEAEDWIGDGNTHIWISLPEGRTSPMLGVCPNGTVTVDWGDGTEPDVLTGTSVSTAKWTPTHNYAKAGDYVITLTIDGTMGAAGTDAANAYSGILRYSSEADALNPVYQTAVKKIELGSGVVDLRISAFRKLIRLEKIKISDSVKNLRGDSFADCYSLKAIEVPESVTAMDYAIFARCYSLTNVKWPSTPPGVGTNTFHTCVCVKDYDFTSRKTVPTLGNISAFTNISPDCKIRVPAALVDEWKAATNWSTYADYIVGV